MMMVPKILKEVKLLLAEWWALGLGNSVIQVIWAIEYVFMLSLLLQHGMSNLLASYAWLPSPILQMVLSPLFGRWSDRLNPWSRFGRRLPFIIAFTVLGAVFLVIIPLASTFGCLLSSDISCDSGATTSQDDTDDNSVPPQYAVLTFLTVSFVGVDFCMSLNVQFQRGLATDMCSSEQIGPRDNSLRNLDDDTITSASSASADETRSLPTDKMNTASEDDFQALEYTPLVDGSQNAKTDSMSGHSILAFSSAGGNAIGFLLAAINWSKLSTALGIANGDVLFLVILALFLFITGMCLLVWKVQKTRRAENARQYKQEINQGLSEEENVQRTISTTTTSHWKLPCKFYILCAQQIIAWIPIWGLWQYGSAYFGTVVEGGSPRASSGSDLGEKYASGLHLGALTSGLVAAVATISSLVLPSLLNSWGLKRCYLISQLVSAAALLIAHLSNESTACAVIFMSFLGISWAANNSIPYTVLEKLYETQDQQNGKSEDRQNTAFATNVLYLAQTIPQILSAVVLGPIISKLAEGGSIGDYQHAYATPILLGITCQFASAPVALFWFPKVRSSESYPVL